MAGYNPEAIVTTKVVIKAAIIANQGMVNWKPMATAMAKPIEIPSKIPTIPPIWPITKVSVKNCQAIVERFAPNAFRIPISRVRSETETNIIFINAIEDPKTVITPIIQAAMLNVSVLESNV